MKRTFVSLMLAAFIALFGTCAMAGTESYDTKIGGFTIDVPDGWSGKAIPDGCAVHTADKNNVLSVQFFPPNEMTAMQAARKMAGLAKLNVASEKDEGDTAFIDGEKGGMPWAILMVKSEKVLMAVQFAGKDRDAMRKIYDTIHDKVTNDGAPAGEAVIEIEAGPIWNNDNAKKRCPEVLAEWLKANPGMRGEWTGEWSTKVQGKMSVCRIKTQKSQ